MRIQPTVVDPIVHASVDAVVYRQRSTVAAVEPRARLIAPARVRAFAGRLIQAVHRVDRGSNSVGLDGALGERALNLRHEERVSALPRDVDEVGPIEERRGLRKHTFVYMTPKVWRWLARCVQQNVALTAIGDLVAPALERLAKHRRQTDAHQVERRQHVDGAYVGRRGVLGREGEPARERDRDPWVSQDEVGLRQGPNGASLPEGSSGVGGRAVDIDRALPVANEIVETSILVLHVEDEVDEAGRPLREPPIAGIAVEIEKKYDGARRIIDTCDSLEAPLARRETLVFVVGVHSQSGSAPPCRRKAPREPGELPDHFGQGSRLAMISLTEKAAAAIRESAAP